MSSSVEVVIEGAGEGRGRTTASASFSTPLPTGTEPRYGLFLVSEPPTGTKALVDIVAVHGLNGDPVKTYTSEKTGVFWLRDLLPKYLVPSARVLSYGWNATAISAMDKRASPFSENAEYLLNQISTSREGVEKQRPLIFIAHSVGGLLVKQATVILYSLPERFLLPLSFGILFFGTPHNGSSTASYGVLAARMAKIFNAKYSVSAELMNSLKPNSIVLQDLANAFRYVSPNLELATFYETVPSKIGGTQLEIVDNSSSKTNLPNELLFALPASHSDLCRYDDSGDPNFHRVLHVIQDFCRNLLHSNRRAPQNSSTPPRSLPLGLPRLAQPKIPKDYLLEVDVFWIKKMSGSGGRLFSKTIKTITEFLNDGITDIFDRVDSHISEQLLEPPNQQSEISTWTDNMTWIHVPVNNTQWVHPCLMQLAVPLNLKLTITKPEFWMLNETKGKNDVPHSRSMLPSVFFDISRSDVGEDVLLRPCRQLALYLPYLHWDTMECFQQRDNYVRQIYQKKPAAIPTDLEGKPRSIYYVIKDFLNLGASFHPRRSLDQFFYSRLPDTASRDKDQVVSKRTNESEGGPKMIMVDQLWLWIIESKDSPTQVIPDTIEFQDGSLREESKPHASLITFFPEKESEGEGDTLYSIADLKQRIVDRIADSNPKYDSVWLFAAMAIKEAVNIMLEVRYESLNFLEIFREAIGETSEQQTQFFRKFRDVLDRRSTLENTKNEKKQEMRLVLEVADIIDELNTLTRLFEVQTDTLTEALPYFRKNQEVFRSEENDTAVNIIEESIKDVEGYQTQVKRMKDDAERTYNSLLSLLDLQQKEANIDEAHVAAKQLVHAREQADATSAQSQILLLFTVVTIIFLPLSFFTSYFGMNVVEQTGSTGDQSLRHVWTIMGPASAAIIMFCFLSSVVMYFADKRQLEKKRYDEAKNFDDLEGLPLVEKSVVNLSSSEPYSMRKREKENQYGNEGKDNSL